MVDPSTDQPMCICGSGYVAQGLTCVAEAGQGGEPAAPDEPAPDEPAPDEPAPDEPAAFPPVEDFAEAGPYEVTRLRNAGPEGAHTLYYPTGLGADGVLHPIIAWGNGTGAVPVYYQGLLQHWASHGFAVVAANTTMAGDGQEMLAGVRWLLEQNEDPDSVFFGRLDPNAVGASGHSQGGGGAVNAGTDPLVTCTAPLMPAPGNASALKGPMFVVSGTEDTIVPTSLVRRTVYDPSPVPTIFGILEGAAHNAPSVDGGPVRGPVTAWFRTCLMDDETAAELFYGEPCGLGQEEGWMVERKNL